MTRLTAHRALVLMTALSFAGCMERAASEASADKEAGESTITASPPPAQDALEKREEGAMGEDAKRAPTTQRKLIQNAELHVQVDSYSDARAKVEEQLKELGGFVANARVEHHDGQVSYAELTVRIPQEKLAEFLAGTAGQGDVIHETLSSEDITEGYYDTKARLANAQKMEARLLEIVGEKADNVTSLLEVERELARVREQIEVFEGKLRLWDEQVSLSTVKLRLVSKQVHVVTAPPTPPTLGERLSGTLGGSWGALVKFGHGLLILIVALLPWLLPIGLVAYFVRRVVIRHNARRTAQWAARAAEQPAAPTA